MMRTLYIKVELNNKAIKVIVQSIFKIRTKFKQAVEDVRDIKLSKNKLRKTHRKNLVFNKIAIIKAIIIPRIQRLKKDKNH